MALLPTRLRVRSSMVARNSIERRSFRGLFGSWLLLAFVILGLTQPRTAVCCQSGSGRITSEGSETGCCGVSGEGVACAPVLIKAGSSNLDGAARLADRTCTDPLMEASARRSRGLRLSRQHLASLGLSRAAGPFSPLSRLMWESRGQAVRAIENELALSTVLRI